MFGVFLHNFVSKILLWSLFRSGNDKPFVLILTTNFVFNFTQFVRQLIKAFNSHDISIFTSYFFQGLLIDISSNTHRNGI